MNTDPTSLFSLAPKRLQWLATRQNVVSENIANSDVAGDRAQDVQSFASYLEDAGRSQRLQEAEVVEARVLGGATATGNNVNLEEQLVEANSASGQFQMAASLYRKAHEMVYAVAGRK